MKILYFTTTGNSLYVAKSFDDAKLLSIPQLLKQKIYDIDGDIIGIIIPVYVYTSPKLVKKYLENVNIKADYVFVIGTYGSTCGEFGKKMLSILSKRGVLVNYLNTIKMVDNAVHVGFEMKKQKEKSKNLNIDENIKKIIEDINERKDYIKKPLKRYVPLARLTYVFSPLLDKIFTKVMISVDDSCTRCGLCTKVCPYNNIKIKEKPNYGKDCELCLACVHHCPLKAIHVKLERSSERFINENIELKEIIKSNNQN